MLIVKIELNIQNAEKSLALNIVDQLICKKNNEFPPTL